MVLAEFTHRLREADERTVEAPWRHIGEILDHLSPGGCAASIRQAGYSSETI